MKVTIYLDEREGRALKQLARNDMRDPRSQVYLLIRKELESKGLLPPDPALADSKNNEIKEASNDLSSR